MEKGDSFERVAGILGKIGDKTAVTPLVGALSDWPVRRAAAAALDDLDWKPELPDEKVHYLLATSQPGDAAVHGQAVQEVLLADLRSGKRRLTGYAVEALLATGGEAAVPELISILENQGSIVMAEAYWNSRNTRLAQAAEDWARAVA